MTKIQVGDTVFNGSGDPGIVTKKAPNGNLTVQVKGEKYESSRKVGFINGLPPEDKAKYDSVVVDIRKEHDKPVERIEALTEKIQELNKNPKNFLLAKYLVAEKAHIINSENIKIDDYQVNEGDI